MSASSSFSSSEEFPRTTDAEHLEAAALRRGNLVAVVAQFERREELARQGAIEEADRPSVLADMERWERLGAEADKAEAAQTSATNEPVSSLYTPPVAPTSS